ncbi:hypothetical protein [Chryseobacterium foetidum]|uniref:hypothetical protein n=1 Tax=Chryseobacterium foetidum TaxID=2951057 RepID=UPI0021C56C59|nr:hypothetical protein [Chryseobacterium foetidum]
MEIQHVTIDTDYSQEFSLYSDGGMLYKFIKHPDSLNPYENDLFCLSQLAGLAADIVNEHDGDVSEEYFLTEDFSNKISHIHYYGDIMAHTRFQKPLLDWLQIPITVYNQISVMLLANLFSNDQILPSLLHVRNQLEEQKTILGNSLTSFLDQTALAEYKKSSWQDVKEIRKRLFF